MSSGSDAEVGYHCRLILFWNDACWTVKVFASFLVFAQAMQVMSAKCIAL